MFTARFWIKSFKSQPPAIEKGRLRANHNRDFLFCCIAGFQTCPAHDDVRLADLEIGDTAGLETCATLSCSLRDSTFL
jgi:hypothetical protein